MCEAMWHKELCAGRQPSGNGRAIAGPRARTHIIRRRAAPLARGGRPGAGFRPTRGEFSPRRGPVPGGAGVPSARGTSKNARRPLVSGLRKQARALARRLLHTHCGDPRWEETRRWSRPEKTFEPQRDVSREREARDGDHVLGCDPVRAEVMALENLSAHADSEEILGWLGHFGRPPRAKFITHGEPRVQDALRLRIEERLHWTCLVPEYRQRVRLA
jgi:hypothetical protein